MPVKIQGFLKNDIIKYYYTNIIIIKLVIIIIFYYSLFIITIFLFEKNVHEEFVGAAHVLRHFKGGLVCRTDFAEKAVLKIEKFF